MTATGHAVIGVVIAVTIPNPFVAVPLAVGSHILADLFPHWDAGTNRNKKSKDRFVMEATADVVLSMAITFFLVVYLFPQTSLIYAYLIVFASQFFDWASAPYLFLRITNPPIFKWFYDFQKNFDSRLDKPWGVIGQVTLLIILVGIAMASVGTPLVLAN